MIAAHFFFFFDFYVDQPGFAVIWVVDGQVYGTRTAALFGLYINSNERDGVLYTSSLVLLTC